MQHILPAIGKFMHSRPPEQEPVTLEIGDFAAGAVLSGGGGGGGGGGGEPEVEAASGVTHVKAIATAAIPADRVTLTTG
jgi:hypothetical protein